ncbi:hypothetical protein KIW84_052459 [Lathyrus oleraceus]|uniref:WAT1-related protein n=1 Tax=Pisum sativum TaxID=3888 RepID=A0A9D4WRT0_PEA|nr:hypothetical protein KIW84_052459 [Pisum sativum]
MGNVTVPFVGMVIAECVQVALIILSKQVMAQGMTSFIFIFYSNSIAAIVLLPSSFYIHRFQRPPITFSTLSGFFILGLLGMEQLDWRSYSSLAKSLGTIVSIAGAFIATLYKGAALLKGPSPANLYQQLDFSQDTSWIIGGSFLAADCVVASAFLIVQASILKKYPAGLIVVFFYCFFVAILSAVTCLVVERDINAWSLKPKLRLLSVLYSGVFGSAFQVGVTTWCLHQTGPVFVSMFKPIGIVISVVIGVVFLGDAFYLGSLIGATVIVIGFYSVLWGKSKDIDAISLESRGNHTPLLKENNSEDV